VSPIVIVPASGFSAPTSIRKSVVLPAPFGPMMPTIPDRGQRERQVLDEQPVAEALPQVLDLDDLVAEARPGGMTISSSRAPPLSFDASAMSCS
jgi:hypothetical protein